MDRVLSLEEMEGEILDALYESVASQWTRSVADALFTVEFEVVEYQDPISGSVETGTCAICNESLPAGSHEELMHEDDAGDPYCYVCADCQKFTKPFDPED